MSPVAIPPRLCANCRLARVAAFESRDRYSATIQATRNGTRIFPARSTLHSDGEAAPRVATIYSGWATRFRTLDDGRRQILRILLPGDLIGAGAIFDRVSDCTVEAVTDVVLCVFPLQTMRSLVEADAEVAGKVAELMYQQVVSGHDHLTNVATRSALERLAWFLLELFERLEQRAMVESDSCAMPLTQAVIGDALGLAPANVSRLTRELREMGLLNMRRGRMTILDRAGLARLACRSESRERADPLF